MDFGVLKGSPANLENVVSLYTATGVLAAVASCLLYILAR